MRIREAELADAMGMARVIVDGWQSAYRGIVPDQFLGTLSYETRAERFALQMAPENRLAGSFNLVAVEGGGRIVGLASAGPVRGETWAECEGELYALYVQPELKRQGTGGLLVQEVARRLLAQGFSKMLVWVLAENPHRTFYEKMGGVHRYDQTITIDGKDLAEAGYVWDDIRSLAAGDAAK